MNSIVFVKHTLKVKYYLRYGDDFILIYPDKERLNEFRRQVISFLFMRLRLKLNKRNDIIIKANQGLRFLGAVIYSTYRLLNKRNRHRIMRRLNLTNSGSYFGLVTKYGEKDTRNIYDYLIY